MSRSNLALRLPDGAPFAANERVALDNILGRASGEQPLGSPAFSLASPRAMRRGPKPSRLFRRPSCC